MTTASVLKKRDVLKRAGISQAGMYRMMHAGTFPKPIRLEGRAVGWRVDEIDAWIESRPRALTEAR